MREKSHLIVTGTARSGTTALTHLLNAHEQVCVGIERFKFRYLLENDYSPEFLSRARFFRFEEADTNQLPARRPMLRDVYRTMEQKWDTARVVGDKVPDMAPILEDFLEQNPDFKCIYILRNIKDVALSWQRRADRPRDRWPRAKGFAAACTRWEEHTRIFHDMLARGRHRSRILVLDHDAIYTPEAKTVLAIRAFLDLEPSTAFTEAWHKNMEFVAARREQERGIPRQHLKAYRATDGQYGRLLRKYARTSLPLWAERLAPETGC